MNSTYIFLKKQQTKRRLDRLSLSFKTKIKNALKNSARTLYNCIICITFCYVSLAHDKAEPFKVYHTPYIISHFILARRIFN